MAAETIAPDQAPRWADAPLASPTYGSAGSKATVICATSGIAASPAACLAAVLDPGRYPAWNRFVPRATVLSSPATSAELPPASTPAALLAQPAFRRNTPDKLLLLGTRVRFEVHMNPGAWAKGVAMTDLEVSVLETFERGGEEGGKKRKGLRVAWKTQGDPWYLKAERTQEFLEREDGGTDYVCYETFFGPVAPVVKMVVGAALLRNFGMWAEDLKRFAEEGVKEEGEGEEEGTGGAQ
ncbi:hypothetical protein SLS62_000051 [Diatrype stigma]|uniref:Coenzyme Q-binding protein COQ10 START domain-containing protein n=1 Tax=Diatrype stigma TaxID=117547 RepID=A0AAN9UY12_9PEZI